MNIVVDLDFFPHFFQLFPIFVAAILPEWMNQNFFHIEVNFILKEDGRFVFNFVMREGVRLAAVSPAPLPLGQTRTNAPNAALCGILIDIGKQLKKKYHLPHLDCLVFRSVPGSVRSLQTHFCCPIDSALRLSFFIRNVPWRVKQHVNQLIVAIQHHGMNFTSSMHCL